MSGRIFILEGLPGVGKTLFCSSMVVHDKNVKVLAEWVDEKILQKYIVDMKKYASRFQFRIQNETMNRMREAVKLAKAGFTVFVDRGITGNRCFAELQHQNGLISQADIDIYRRAYSYDNIEGLKEVEFHVIYMKAKVSTCLAHIKKRDRSGESAYDAVYLGALKEMHEKLLPEAEVIECDENHKLTNGVIPRDILRRSLEAY
jgi:deoxyadenosine/deoxycytidine kinase